MIWSTTPLALKWSTQEVGFLFGAVSRMSLGFVCVMIVAALRREFLRFDLAALKVYAAAAVGIYGAMICAYWGAQFIPSGWVALVFGLSPVFTALLAALLLGERTLAAHKILAQLFGLGGLAAIFYSGLAVSVTAVLGIAAVVLATTLHALSAVLIKRINSDIPAVIVVGGGLLLSLGPYYLTWWCFDGTLPATVPARTAMAILYQGTIATTVGFSLYFYVLKHHSASQVALITFVSPITALALGNLLDGEAFEPRVLAGAGLVLVALFLHEILPAWRNARHRPIDPAHAAEYRETSTRVTG